METKLVKQGVPADVYKDAQGILYEVKWRSGEAVGLLDENDIKWTWIPKWSRLEKGW